MANTHVYYREWRFIFEEELTQVYVRVVAYNDVPIGVQGWHHKTFPASKSMVDIIQEAFSKGGEYPILWPQDAPKQLTD